MLVIPALGSWRQEDQKFKVTYITNSRISLGLKTTSKWEGAGKHTIQPSYCSTINAFFPSMDSRKAGREAHWVEQRFLSAGAPAQSC